MSDPRGRNVTPGGSPGRVQGSGWSTFRRMPRAYGEREQGQRRQEVSRHHRRAKVSGHLRAEVEGTDLVFTQVGLHAIMNRTRGADAWQDGDVRAPNLRSSLRGYGYGTNHSGCGVDRAVHRTSKEGAGSRHRSRPVSVCGSWPRITSTTVKSMQCSTLCAACSRVMLTRPTLTGPSWNSLRQWQLLGRDPSPKARLHDHRAVRPRRATSTGSTGLWRPSMASTSTPAMSWSPASGSGL